MSGPESWYLSAESRWAHLPQGADRDRRVRATFDRIRDEAEAIALRLPELDEDERAALLHEAVLDIHSRYGLPLTDVAEGLFAIRVDAVFERLCIVAREQKAPEAMRAKLLERRFMRLPGVRRYLGLEPE